MGHLAFPAPPSCACWFASGIPGQLHVSRALKLRFLIPSNYKMMRALSWLLACSYILHWSAVHILLSSANMIALSHSYCLWECVHVAGPLPSLTRTSCRFHLPLLFCCLLEYMLMLSLLSSKQLDWLQFIVSLDVDSKSDQISLINKILGYPLIIISKKIIIRSSNKKHFISRGSIISHPGIRKIHTDVLM